MPHAALAGGLWLRPRTCNTSVPIIMFVTFARTGLVEYMKEEFGSLANRFDHGERANQSNCLFTQSLRHSDALWLWQQLSTSALWNRNGQNAGMMMDEHHPMTTYHNRS